MRQLESARGSVEVSQKESPTEQQSPVEASTQCPPPGVRAVLPRAPSSVSAQTLVPGPWSSGISTFFALCWEKKPGAADAAILVNKLIALDGPADAALRRGDEPAELCGVLALLARRMAEVVMAE